MRISETISNNDRLIFSQMRVGEMTSSKIIPVMTTTWRSLSFFLLKMFYSSLLVLVYLTVHLPLSQTIGTNFKLIFVFNKCNSILYIVLL